MKNISISIVILSFLFSACSTGQKALERGDYYQAISKAVERLQSDPDNRNATRVLSEGYPLAIKYYQEEIDLALMGGDPFKWGKTVEIMEQMNNLAQQIRRVPAARKQVPNPKIYASEIRPAKEKAAEELYRAGIGLMERETREDARQAYRYFLKADQMIPGFGEVNRLIPEAKDRATFKVIVEQIPVFTERYALSANFFYDRVLGMLRYNFPEKSFVNFYSENEAGNRGIEHPDMILKMNFYDFHIGRNQHAESEQILTRVVEERVKVNSRKDTTIYETRMHEYKGKIKVINDQVLTEGILNVDVIDFQGDRMLLKERIPGQFMWTNSYGLFVGDKEVLDQNHIAILNNQAYPPPPAQELFIQFSRPVFDQLSSRLNSFFRKYN